MFFLTFGNCQEPHEIPKHNGDQDTNLPSSLSVVLYFTLSIPKPLRRKSLQLIFKKSDEIKHQEKPANENTKCWGKYG